MKNVTVVAHRGWGKTILLKDIGFELTKKHQDISVFFFNMEALFDINTFIRRFITELYSTFSIRIPAHINLSDPDIGMLSLTQKLAARRKIRLILFISNFQQIYRFENSPQLLAKLFHCWRKQENCVYCISGHNRHFFNTYFRNPGKPFSRFARIYMLKKNISRSYISYVKSLFFYADKEIERDAAVYVQEMTDNHLYYLQVLSWRSYLRTDHTCTRSIVESAFKSMVCESELYTSQLMAQLTEKQFNYLRALANYTKRVCSKESLEKYNLGSSSNIARIKINLEKKGILEVNREFTAIIDPLLISRLKEYL